MKIRVLDTESTRLHESAGEFEIYGVYEVCDLEPYAQISDHCVFVRGKNGLFPLFRNDSDYGNEYEIIEKGN